MSDDTDYNFEVLMMNAMREFTDDCERKGRGVNYYKIVNSLAKHVCRGIIAKEGHGQDGQDMFQEMMQEAWKSACEERKRHRG
jgi:DNA-directed RNA polymerase specialized sigma24 family protein